MHSSVAALSFAIALYCTSVNSQNFAQHRVSPRTPVNGPWSLVQKGKTGVSAQQLAITSETTAIIFDKVEQNPLQTQGHSAWAAEYDLTTNQVRALNPLTNTWCGAGAYLSNGTLISTGGSYIPSTGVKNGLQAVRFFDSCSNKQCDVREYPSVHLTSNRWYSTASRLDDGSIILFGGSTKADFINGAEIINPTYEFYPPKNINGHNGIQIDSPFLLSTLNANHFPIVFLLPSGQLFVAANNAAMLFNWRTNTETRLPSIPNGVRVCSPFSAAAALLPLTPPYYTPTVLICGGSTVSDKVAPSKISSQTPASRQCASITLDAAGIARGWQVETLPQPRIMGEAILLPDTRVLLINGAQTGVAGYGTVADPIGSSDADSPAFTPVIYDPSAPLGSRFSSNGLPASPIARMYHSTATLTPNATILIAGSNPNDDVQTRKYATEYRVEHLSPAYMYSPRPTYTGLPATVDFGATFTLSVTLPEGVTSVYVSLMDLGFATHAVHMDQRLVILTSTLSAYGTTLTVTAPPNGTVYPPGPGYLYVVTSDGVPSFGSRVLLGGGHSPPVDLDSIENLRKMTANSVQSLEKPLESAEGEGSYIPAVPIPAETKGHY